MRNIVTISLVTWKESLRNKLFAGLLVFWGLILIFSFYISTLSLGTVARFIENAGMAGITLVCLAVTILFGLYSIYQEKERNELYVIINRVSRSTYLLGRFLGTTYLIALFSFLTGGGIFILAMLFGGQYDLQIFWAVYWAVLEFTLLLGLGLLFYALNVGFTVNSMLVLGAFIVGHSTTEAIQSFIGLGRFGSKLHFWMVKTLSLIIPDLDMFDFRLQIIHDQAIPTGEAALSTLYWLMYVIAVLALASAVMKRRDI